MEPDKRMVKAIKIKITYKSRGSSRHRTIDLPKTARDIHARVYFEFLFSHSFEIPIESVEAGLAEWFQRTDGEMKSILGGTVG